MSQHRARIITTAKGKFMHCEDCKRALLDDAFVMECMAVLKVGIERFKDSHLEAFRHALGNAFMELSGDADEARARAVKRKN